MKVITKRFLKSKGACLEGLVEVEKWGLLGLPVSDFLDGLMEHGRFDYANWLIVELFTRKKQSIQYAVYAAELVIDIYEKEYPKDDRPRRAIEAAKECIKKQSAKNIAAAWSAARSAAWSAESARSARSARSAAWSAARSAAWSARSAESARSAAWSARSARSAAWSAARSAARSAAWSARSAARSAELQKSIIEYGFNLISN